MGQAPELPFSDNTHALAQIVIEGLTAQGRNLALAESCTGGLVAKTLTDIPGASACFLLSAVTYANEAKRDLLGVSEKILEDHGAVSAPCATAMAEGLRRISSADLALSITGIAGPGGGSEDKPIGTVYFGLNQKSGTRVHHHVFPSQDRSTIRAMACHMALTLIQETLFENPRAGMNPAPTS
ncbi:MAG: CinA family protein [Deltaproteobacteria bacterium]|nr:CinA family protein [Deltaproteobacteria bacterium]